jgi:peptidoglycan/xylan/chitin deacetylase (PgdA/CDA1 family)
MTAPIPQNDPPGTGAERDFIGYGATPPDPRWPGGARLALNLVLNFEEGSEPSFPDGDGVSESGLTEATGPGGGRDLAAESMFEYGSRVGFWRLLRILRDHGAPATIFGCAVALQRNPPAVEAIKAAGFDLCCHGRRWVQHMAMDEAQERAEIAEAVRILTGLFGEPPPGWYCRYGPSPNTRRLLVEHGGFIYDSDAYNDELPYWRRVGGTPHLVVPYSLTNNDSKFIRGGMTTADDFFKVLLDAAELLVREGATQPKMMSVGMHLRLMGHPARAAALERFLDRVAGRSDIWLCRRIDIARHWIAQRPCG